MDKTTYVEIWCLTLISMIQKRRKQHRLLFRGAAGEVGGGGVTEDWKVQQKVNRMDREAIGRGSNSYSLPVVDKFFR